MRASRAQLSLASNRPNQQIKLGILPILKRILRHLSRSLIGSNKLRIWQTYERGNNWWHAFDPLTGNHTSVNSQARLLAWIELNYPDDSPKVD